MTITVPITNKLSLNKIYGGIHHRTRTMHKEEYREVVWSVQPPAYSGEFPVNITYHFKFKGKRLDSSNCAYLVKLIEDALVAEEVIPDDGAKYVYSSRMITDSGENEVDIIIEPCGS